MRQAVTWRRSLLSLCALGVLLLAVNAWSINRFGDAGVTALPSGSPFIDRLAVTPGSPAARSGLRDGELVDIRRFSPSDRYRWRAFFTFGERVAVPFKRSGEAGSKIVVASLRHSWDTDSWLAYAGQLWMLLFAAAIVWRRADSAEARTLAMILIAYSIGVSLAPQIWITPSAAIDAVVNAISQSTNYIGASLLAAYAMLFARPPGIGRRLLAWGSYVSAGVASAYTAVAFALLWTAAADPTGSAFSSPAARLVQNALPWLLPLLCVFATLAATRGNERSRLVWATASLTPLYVINFAEAAFTIDPAFAHGAGVPWLYLAANLAVFVAPMGLTYSVLSHRLIPIGFAVNRTAVFSGVSLVIVGIFVLVEALLGRWLQNTGREANVIVGAALALVLGLSVRAVHLRVDRVVDAVFFRKRHEDEKAIRAFAREAPYITSRTTLVERAVEILQMRADASFVTIELDEGAGRYGCLSANDPAVLRLRALHEALDLRTVPTEASGEFAYPMVARGRLVGVLILGPKRSRESYAPDESDAIAQLAHGVGAALDVFSLKESASDETIVPSIVHLLETTYVLSENIASLSKAVEALPAEVHRAVSDAIAEQCRILRESPR